MYVHVCTLQEYMYIKNYNSLGYGIALRPRYHSYPMYETCTLYINFTCKLTHSANDAHFRYMHVLTRVHFVCREVKVHVHVCQLKSLLATEFRVGPISSKGTVLVSEFLFIRCNHVRY